MTSLHVDTIRVIEACDAPAATDEAWLSGIAGALASIDQWLGEGHRARLRRGRGGEPRLPGPPTGLDLRLHGVGGARLDPGAHRLGRWRVLPQGLVRVQFRVGQHLCTTYMTTARSVTATFEPSTDVLTLTWGGTGTGSTFKGWGIVCTGTCNVKMNASKSVLAAFLSP